MMLMNLIPLPYRLLALAALVAAIYVAGYIAGKSAEQGAQAKSVVAEIKLTQKAEQKTRVETAKAADASEMRVEKTRIVYRDVIREVIKYAETDNGRAVCIGADWVREHNRAATPENLPAPAGEIAFPAGQPTNARALGVVATNYETCNVWRESVIGWQAWYRASGLAAQHE